MSTTKEIQTTALLSVVTGLQIHGVEFHRVHEAIEHLLGEPVWTHQLGSPEPWRLAREAVIAQYPIFANVDGDALRAAVKGQTREEATIRANAWAEAELTAIGASTFTVTKGDGRDPSVAQEDAIESLRVIAKDKPVIVVTAPSAGTN
jgi:hypothetical protein